MMNTLPDTLNELNELTFRQKVMQNPWQLDAQTEAYLKAHPEMKNWLNQLRKRDQRLKKTLQSVPVPDALADKILLNTFSDPASNEAYQEMLKESAQASTRQTPSSVLHRASWFQMLGWGGLGLVASLLAVTLFYPQLKTNSVTHQTAQIATRTQTDTHQQQMLAKIEQDLMAHVTKHANFMQKTTPVDPERLTAMLETVGAKIASPMDFVTHASECTIHGMKGVHLVIQTFDGPVTLIVLPKIPLKEMVAFKKSLFQGELLPVQGATLAILGQDMKQVGWAQMAFLEHVQFVQAESR